MKLKKNDIKICEFCGQVGQEKECPYCSTKYGSLIFGYKAPDKKFKRKILYGDWLEKIDAFLPYISQAMDSDTRQFVDLGCGPNHLVKRIRQNYPWVDAVGYDRRVLEDNTVAWDFEKEKLPFENQNIDVICLSHVLEHVENFHFILDEAFRVGKKIIVILPNCINAFSLTKAFFGRNMGVLLGLPPVKPQDRHKWFFSVKQADQLMGYYAAKFNKKYAIYYFSHPRAPNILNRLNANLFSKEVMYIFS